MSFYRSFLFLLFFALLAFEGTASAKSASFDTILFKPATDNNLYAGIYGADSLNQWQYTFGLYTDISANSLKAFTGAGVSTGNIISYNLVGNFYGSVGLLPFLSTGLNLPVAFLESFNDPTTGANSKEFESGDLGLNFKLKALDHERFPVGIAIVPFVTFPTGSDTHFTGSGKITGGFLAVIDSPRLFDRLSLSLNTGVLARSEATVVSSTNIGTQFLYGLGANLAVLSPLDLLVELRGSSSNFFKKAPQSPLEIEPMVRYYFPRLNLAFTAGGGTGIIEGVGAPEWRVLAGVSYLIARPFGEKSRDNEQEN
ncbi:MAG: transporter [Deltaproteobacteria bacterium]|nr:transporter [Deltaproteobacteria bacterium]